MRSLFNADKIFVGQYGKPSRSTFTGLPLDE